MAAREVGCRGFFRIKAGAGLSHQFPDIRQLAGLHAGDGLAAERARHADLAVEQRLGARGRWHASLFTRGERGFLRLENSEPRLAGGQIAGPIEPHLDNALRAESSGVEFLLQATAVRGLTGWVSYAFGHTRVQDTLTGERFDGDFDQRHTFNAYARYRLSNRTTLSAKLRLGSNVPIAGYLERRDGELFVSEHRNLARLPVYARLDARVNRVFNFTRRRLTLFVEVLNILNRENFGPDDGSVAFRTGRASGFSRTLLPLLPSAGLIVEF